MDRSEPNASSTGGSENRDTCIVHPAVRAKLIKSLRAVQADMLKSDISFVELQAKMRSQKSKTGELECQAREMKSDISSAELSLTAIEANNNLEKDVASANKQGRCVRANTVMTSAINHETPKPAQDQSAEDNSLLNELLNQPALNSNPLRNEFILQTFNIEMCDNILFID